MKYAKYAGKVRCTEELAKDDIYDFAGCSMAIVKTFEEDLELIKRLKKVQDRGSVANVDWPKNYIDKTPTVSICSPSEPQATAPSPTHRATITIDFRSADPDAELLAHSFCKELKDRFSAYFIGSNVEVRKL